MPPSLATFILLSGHLFSSSASFLKTIKPFHEEFLAIESLAASPFGPPSTSLRTTALTSLTGYYAIGIYSDSSCTAPLYLVFYPLDTCYPTSSTTYESITATSTTVTITKYSDSKCTTVVNVSVESNSVTCSSSTKYKGVKAYISSTSKGTSSAATLIQRYMN